jgi:hypothetical protein
MAPLTDVSYIPAHDPSTLSSLGSNYETAQHSWHVIRMSNPDFIRPITFRIYAQRTDCFTAYPSEGYLLPGETCYITLGIRAMGSVLAQAYDDVDTKREEVHRFLADVFDEESVLPQCGYVVRYFYAPPIPCIPSEYRNFKDSVLQTPVDPTIAEWLPRHDTDSSVHGLIQKLWNNLQTEDTVRTIHISTHVNGKYAFDEFQSRAMCPFEVNATFNSDTSSDGQSCPYPLTLITPNVQHKYPKLFSLLHDMHFEIDSSHAASSYRTEKECICCGKDWGARSEYLGRIFVLRKAVCEEMARHRSRQMHRLVNCLKLTPTLFSHVLPEKGKSVVIDVDNNLLNRIHQILFCLHAILVSKRGDKLVTTRQREILRSLEVYEAIASGEVLRLLFDVLVGADKEQNSKEDRMLIWRQAGIYDKPKTTNSSDDTKMQAKNKLERVGESSKIVVKKEPGYLRNVRRFRHLPGFVPVGKPDDPNHFDESTSHLHSDIFKDNSTLGFMSALAMMQDSRALSGQGVYHIIMGAIPKSQDSEQESFIACSTRDMQELCRKSLKKLGKINTNLRIDKAEQNHTSSCSIFPVNDLDFDSYRFLIERHADNHVSSFENFITNVPAPGIGRFQLSKLNTRDDGISTDTIGQLVVPRPSVSSNTVTQRRVNRTHNRRRIDRRPPLMVGHFGGLRFFNALWYLSSQVGWSVDDEANPGEIIVDRRIMIATQWVSNSLMFLPLLWTLIARWAMLVSPIPLEYYLEGLVS